MLYKDCYIQIWRSEWLDKRINGEWYSSSVVYCTAKQLAKEYCYLALVSRIHPTQRWYSYHATGGSTPAIALDLAKFAIDLYSEIYPYSWSVKFPVTKKQRKIKLMKIKQDLETGKLQYQLDAGEEYDADEYVRALTEFVGEQAVTTFCLTKSYRKLVQRLDELEARINPIDNNQIAISVHNFQQKHRKTQSLVRSSYFSGLTDITLANIIKIYLSEKQLPEETLLKFAEHNQVDRISLIAVAVLAHQELLAEVLTRFHNQIQIYLEN